MFFHLVYFLFVISCAVSAWWLHFTETRFYKLCTKIPGPKPIPIVGNLFKFFDVLIDRKKFVEVALKTTSGSVIYRIHIGKLCHVLLQDPDDIHTVLSSNKTLSKSTDYLAVSHLLGYSSLFTETRDRWRRYRRIMNRSFKIPVVRDFIGIFNEKSKTLVNNLRSESNGNKFDINYYIKMSFLETISKTNLGFDLPQNQQSIFLNCMDVGKEFIQAVGISPFLRVNFIYRFSRVCRETQRIKKIVHSILDPVIKTKARFYAHQNNSGKAFQTRNNLGFLDSVYQRPREDSDVMTENEIFDQVLTLVFAGMDTSAFTMSVCFMLLGLYKDIQEKVFKELQDIFHDDFYRDVKFEDVQRMVYTEQVIKETLRLYPIAFVFGRLVDEDIEIGGYVFPPGVNIVISPYLLHRNAKYYPDPIKFDPDRFSSENSKLRHPHAFIPFSSGPRMCVGHYYAMLQMKIVLCYVLRHFEFLPCGSRDEMEEIDMAMMMSLKNGYNVRIKSREL